MIHVDRRPLRRPNGTSPLFGRRSSSPRSATCRLYSDSPHLGNARGTALQLGFDYRPSLRSRRPQAPHLHDERLCWTSEGASPQRNQRTLEAGLRMADTLREGIQSLAETQADWIKSFIGSRAFLRHSAAPQLLALPEPARPEEDADDEEEAPASGTDRAMELGLAVVTLINNFVSRSTPVSAPKQGSAKFDVRSLFDWRHASKQGETARAYLGPRSARRASRLPPR